MALTLTINGVSFSYPQTGDVTWGDNTANWAVAVTNGMLQKAGGTFQLTSEVDFGTGYGLKSLYFRSRSANVASTGPVRLAVTDAINFRNNANSADLPIGVNGTDQLTFKGTALTLSGAIANADVAANAAIAYTKLALTGSILNADLAGSIAYSKLSLTGAILNSDLAGSIAYSKLSLTGAILNSDLAGSIAYSKLALTGAVQNTDLAGSIATSKLAAVTPSRALVSDSSGYLTNSSVLTTELAQLSGVGSAVRGNSDAATLTNKTFGDAPTFTQVSTPTTPSAGTSKIYAKSDGFFYALDPSGAERKIGSGAGGINYFQQNADAESGITPWTTYADGNAFPSSTAGTTGSATLTFAASSDTSLRGNKNFLLTPGALGNGTVFTITPDKADAATMLTISFDVLTAGTYTDGDVQVYIVDANGSTVIQPAPYKILKGSAVQKFSTVFQTPSTMTTLRVLLHQATSNTGYTVRLDNFQCGPVSRVFAAPVTDWQSYTLNVTAPTTNPTKGTVVIDKAQWRRVGDSMEIQYQYKQSTAGGAGSGGIYSFPLPSGVSIDTSKRSFDIGADGAVGPAAASDGTTNYLGYVYPNSATTLAMVLINGTTVVNPSSSTFMLSNGTLYYSFSALVPIAGWSSSVQMSNDTDTRVVSMRARKNTGSHTTSGSLQDVASWTETNFDTHGSFNATTGVYTVPVAGLYEVFGSVALIANATGLRIVSVQKNGTGEEGRGWQGPASAATDNGMPYSVLVQCNAGDTLRVQAYQNSGGTLGYSATLANTTLNIKRLTGPSAIAASETVAARYTAASQSIANATTAIVNFETKDYDTHGAVTIGASWQFKAPVSGKYAVRASAIFTNASFTANAICKMMIYKGGSLFSILHLTVPYATGTVYVGLTGGDTISLLAGEYIDIRMSHSETTGRSLDGGAGANHISIERVGN